VKIACGGFYDAILQKTIGHSGNDRLTGAVTNTGKRSIGDGFGWSGNSPLYDVSATDAVTYAWSAHQKAITKPKKQPQRLITFPSS